MALQSMTALASITLQEATSSLSFSGIPQNYRDLVLVFNGTISAASYVRLRYNGDTGSNYSGVQMSGRADGTNSASGTYSAIDLPWNQPNTGVIINTTAQIMDYSATDKHKTLLARSSGTHVTFGFSTYAEAWRWANTSAITTILVATTAGSFNIGTTINLYGRIG